MSFCLLDEFFSLVLLSSQTLNAHKSHFYLTPKSDRLIMHHYVGCLYS